MGFHIVDVRVEIYPMYVKTDSETYQAVGANELGRLWKRYEREREWQLSDLR